MTAKFIKRICSTATLEALTFRFLHLFFAACLFSYKICVFPLKQFNFRGTYIFVQIVFSTTDHKNDIQTNLFTRRT